MQQLLNWLLAHWEPLAGIGVVIISTIISVIASVKKGKVTVMNAVNDALPQLIKYAEELYPEGNGDKKLIVVLEYVHKFIEFTFGLHGSDVTKYDDLITKRVELILSTPEKKGDSDEK